MVHEKLRNMALPIMVVVLVAFISTIFVSWGMGGLEGKKNIAGTVDGKDIPLRYFDQMVNYERQRMQESYDGDIPPHQYAMVPRQVWEKQVSEILHGRVFREMGLTATADEIFEYLKKNPPAGIDTMAYFQTNDQFDTSRYIAFLNNPSTFDDPGMRQFEMHTQMFTVPSMKLENLLNAGIRPTRTELARAYRQENEQAVFEYAVVHSSDFVIDSSGLNDAMIREYYTAHQDSFFEQTQAELYYVRIPKVASARDEMMYLDELRVIKSRIEDGESTFDEEARLESDDPGTAENGGDLGWFGKGSMVPRFEETTFSLKPGVVSEPFRTQFGYHIVLVEEKRKNDKGEQEVRARHILRKVAPTLETIDSLEMYAENLLDRMKKEGFSAVVAQDSGVEFDSTGLFKKGEFVNKTGYVPGMSRFAFEKKTGEIFEQVAMGNRDALYLFQIKRRLPEGRMPLDAVRNRIIGTLLDSLKNQKAQARLSAVLASAGRDGSIAGLSTIDTLVRSGVSDTVTFMSYVPDIGYQNAAMAAVFTVPEGAVSEIVGLPDGCAVVKPLWRNRIESIPWDSHAVATLWRRHVADEQQRAHFKWYLAYMRNARVKSYIDEYYHD